MVMAVNNEKARNVKGDVNLKKGTANATPKTSQNGSAKMRLLR
jgi:hypothetical protein